MRSLPWCALLVAVGLAGCGVELEHGLDERQANEIAAILGEHGLSADKARDEGQGRGAGDAWKITVPRADLARAYQLLESYDLPKRGRRGVDELLADKSLLPSVGEEHTRLEAARSAELERTLERVPGVVCARVHLALPDAASLDPVRAAARASVLLRTQGVASITDAQVQQLVAGAVSGLERSAVQVIITGGAMQPPSTPTEAVGPISVARGERGRVVAIAASGLALLVLLGGALLLTALRLASARREDQSASKRSG
jgi:type III secretion protein J